MFMNRDKQKKAMRKRYLARINLEAACNAQDSGCLDNAIELYALAAKFGSVEAMVNLGNLYSDSRGKKRNLLAKKLYKDAYKKGCAYGATALGCQYRIEGDLNAARIWFKRALKYGDLWAGDYLVEISPPISSNSFK